MALRIVILAAGQGKRMHSRLPKVLHTIAGQPMLNHVISTAQQLAPQSKPLVIYGHAGEQIKHALADLAVEWIPQAEQLGTGHAVQQSLAYLADTDRVLILYGDVPLISHNTLKQLIAATPVDALGIITAHVSNPTGLGRIIRNTAGVITSIIEEKDATAEQRTLTEINTGIYLVPALQLKKWLPCLQNNNQQKEYYLTDIVALAGKENMAITSIKPAAVEEILGVNDRQQLANLERHYQLCRAQEIMAQGVTLLDPHRFDLRGEATIGQDSTIDVNVILEGKVQIGQHCYIGPNTILKNVTIGDHTEIKANSVIEGANIADRCHIGPFARIRPETVVEQEAHIGNFVELKKSHIGVRSKINHLSYIGDSRIGQQVNIGAGTITCNYDGANKHQTIIGDNAFIGSNTQLVAPITIGEGATIGAGSTITRNAPPHQLTVCRSQQRTIENWQRPKKKES